MSPAGTVPLQSDPRCNPNAADTPSVGLITVTKATRQQEQLGHWKSIPMFESVVNKHIIGILINAIPDGISLMKIKCSDNYHLPPIKSDDKN